LSFDISDAPETFDEVRPWLSGGEGKTLYAAKGCDACGHTGYASRTGVFEVMPISKSIRAMVSAGATAAEVRARAVEEKMLEFRSSALLKVARGQTSTEEVFRVVPSEHMMTEE
jgi:type II secretory ATPase GspE/PulE/Tfp pilus assembly ATPase PilB-like protein